jgi:uncharacterized protein (TIRG00374 family)
MKKHLGNALRVLISVGMLAYLFNGIFRKEAMERVANLDTLPWAERTVKIWSLGPQALVEVFRQVQPLWFVLAIACIGVVVVCVTIRWQWMLRVQGLELPLKVVYAINFIGLFFNTFMLGATGGDVMKAWYVARQTHHKKAEAVATVIVDRIVGLLVLFVIALVMMLVFWNRVYDDPRMRTFTVVTLVLVFGTVAVTALSFWKGFADRLPGLRGALRRLPKYETMRRMIEACRVYASHPSVIAKTALITVAVHGFSMLCIVCIGKGLSVTSATLVDYFLYLPIINAISAIPITISGFGVREGMYVAMFSRVGVPGAAALALSLLGYFANLFWSLIGAPFYIAHRKEIPPAEQIEREE